MYVYVYMYILMPSNICIYTYMYIYIFIHVYIHIYMYIYRYIYVCTGIYIYVYDIWIHPHLFIYIYSTYNTCPTYHIPSTISSVPHLQYLHIPIWKKNWELWHRSKHAVAQLTACGMTHTVHTNMSSWGLRSLWHNIGLFYRALLQKRPIMSSYFFLI